MAGELVRHKVLPLVQIRGFPQFLQHCSLSQEFGGEKSLDNNRR